jgi:hypothetical protein
MTIGFTKKLLVVGASATMLALGAAPAGFAGEDDGPTANGERIGSTESSSSSGSSSSGSSSSGSSNSSASKGAVKSAQRTFVATRDTTKPVGAAQTGFGGMAETPGGSLLLALLLGLGGATLLGAAKVAPLDRRSDR